MFQRDTLKDGIRPMQYSKEGIKVAIAFQAIQTVWEGIFNNKKGRCERILQDCYGDTMSQHEVLTAWKLLPVVRFRDHVKLLKAYKSLK